MKCPGLSEFYLAKAVVNQVAYRWWDRDHCLSDVVSTTQILRSVYSESYLSHCVITLGVHDASEGSQGLKFPSWSWARESLF
jgi:hypothetical protein